jgi:hypothetical protein
MEKRKWEGRMCVTDLAISADGQKIFMICDGYLFRSINGGVIFAKLALPEKVWYPLTNLAIAPDEPNQLVVSDSRAGGQHVWKSTNGGAAWLTNSLGTPQSGNTTITDLAITPMVNNKRWIIATIADNKSGLTDLGTVKCYFDNWQNINAVSGTHDYLAVQPSTSFTDNNDHWICVVGVKANGVLDFQIIRVPQGTIENTITFDTAGINAGFTTENTAGKIFCADIALTENFLQDHMAWVGFTRSNYPSPVYFIESTYPSICKNDTQTRNLVFMPGEKMLLVGEYSGTHYWWSQTPNATTPIWYRSPQFPGEGKTLIRTGAKNVYVGTSGRNGGFF